VVNSTASASLHGTIGRHAVSDSAAAHIALMQPNLGLSCDTFSAPDLIQYDRIGQSIAAALDAVEAHRNALSQCFTIARRRLAVRLDMPAMRWLTGPPRQSFLEEPF
jgi:hypothetical protein